MNAGVWRAFRARVEQCAPIEAVGSKVEFYPELEQ